MELPVFATETFEADVLEVYTVSLLVSPLEGEDERACCDKIAVSGADLPDGVKVGDRVRVTYSGEIAESYPAQLNTATLIEIVVSE
ncbi:MAG: DUF3221 domain-containing protein [Clostridia bacterium]|nr:DUF3221 domain-containing protein [Clostridia bacterium]